MGAAAGFVHLRSPDNDYGVVVAGRFAIHEALGPARRPAADHADGMQLVQHVGFGHQDGHRAEGFAAEIGIEAGDNYLNTALSQFLGEGDDVGVEELGFVNSHDCRCGVQLGQERAGMWDWPGRVLAAGVGSDLFECVTVVNDRLEDLHFLTRDSGPPQSADQFIRLPAEH